MITQSSKPSKTSSQLQFQFNVRNTQRDKSGSPIAESIYNSNDNPQSYYGSSFRGKHNIGSAQKKTAITSKFHKKAAHTSDYSEYYSNYGAKTNQIFHGTDRSGNNPQMRSSEVADQIERMSQDSKIEAMHNMFNLTASLKQNVPLHGYIEKIASNSPYYKLASIQSRRGGSSDSRIKTPNVPQIVGLTQQDNNDNYTLFNSQLSQSPKRTIGEGSIYVPGENKYQPGAKLTKLLDESVLLKKHQTKKWLKRKVQFDKFKEPSQNEEVETSLMVKKQYLMSEQEIKQDDIIEAIFTKFDSDGSGSLDLFECIDLFKQNHIRLDKEIVRQLLGGDEFTLQKFKAIISSEQDLQRFKDIFGTQRERVLCELEIEGKVSKDIKQTMTTAPKTSKCCKHAQDYVPQTFEALMESFGIKLQRKTLYEQFKKSYEEISEATKNKNMSKDDVVRMCNVSGEKMKKLLQISTADGANLKNQHNSLFLSLMQGLEHQKKLEKQREDRKLLVEQSKRTFEKHQDSSISEENYSQGNSNEESQIIDKEAILGQDSIATALTAQQQTQDTNLGIEDNTKQKKSKKSSGTLVDDLDAQQEKGFQLEANDGVTPKLKNSLLSLPKKASKLNTPVDSSEQSNASRQHSTRSQNSNRSNRSNRSRHSKNKFHSQNPSGKVKSDVLRFLVSTQQKARKEAQMQIGMVKDNFLKQRYVSQNSLGNSNQVNRLYDYSPSPEGKLITAPSFQNIQSRKSFTHSLKKAQAVDHITNAHDIKQGNYILTSQGSVQEVVGEIQETPTLIKPLAVSQFHRNSREGNHSKVENPYENQNSFATSKAIFKQEQIISSRNQVKSQGLHKRQNKTSYYASVLPQEKRIQLRSQQNENLMKSAGTLQSRSEAIKNFQYQRKQKNMNSRSIKLQPFENPYSKYRPIPLQHDNQNQTFYGFRNQPRNVTSKLPQPIHNTPQTLKNSKFHIALDRRKEEYQTKKNIELLRFCETDNLQQLSKQFENKSFDATTPFLKNKRIIFGNQFQENTKNTQEGFNQYLKVGSESVKAQNFEGSYQPMEKVPANGKIGDIYEQHFLPADPRKVSQKTSHTALKNSPGKRSDSSYTPITIPTNKSHIRLTAINFPNMPAN